MKQRQQEGPYRVRIVKPLEQAVPEIVEAPRFASLESANRYAWSLVNAPGHRVSVEKLAPSGSWLVLSTRW